MKKYSIFLAVVALVLASLACQTIMGGGPSNNAPDVDQPGDVNSDTPQDSGDTNFNVGTSEFATPGDAYNVVAAEGVVTFQTKMSTDDVIAFYRDEFGKQGYTEDTSMAVNFAGAFTLSFTGNGETIYIAGADAGDGSLSVTVTRQ
jgi:hypothetical protein